MAYPIKILQEVANPIHSIHLAHANGFPPECYRVLVRELEDDQQVVALPSRPLWKPAPPPHEFKHWETMADDLLAGLAEHNLAEVIGLGHSMGGTASMIASIRQPERFKALILLDPTLLPRSVLWLIKMTSIVPWMDVPLARKAMARKRQWESFENALSRYQGRRLFGRWVDGALEDYVRSISHENDDGTLDLIYPPEWEAQIYRTIPVDVWKYVPQINVPCLVISGAETDTFTAKSVAYWRKLRPDIPVITLPETTHLLPLEAPKLIAQHIKQFVNQL